MTTAVAVAGHGTRKGGSCADCSPLCHFVHTLTRHVAGCAQIAPVVGLRVATSRGGCLVDYVHPNGPSMEAGLEEGDVVVAVGSTVVQVRLP